MRIPALFAAVALVGCGTVYTSPGVYETGDGTVYSSQVDADVEVIRLTFNSAMDANLSPYVPARLPSAFRPAPTATPGGLSAGSTRMPNLPDVSGLGETAGASADVSAPPAATFPEQPRTPVTNLPPEQETEAYRIGVSDVLLLSANTAGATLDDVPSLLTAQSSRQGYIVQDDGAIAIPDVGRIRVAGLTMEEAEAEIFQALVAQRLDPSFSLEIAEFNSQRISVGGAVRQPRVQPITLKPLYLSEALQLAGGVAAEDLDYAVIRLFRDGEVYQAPVREIFGPSGLTDVLLKNGDAIFVDSDYDLTQARAYFEEQIRLRDYELREREFAFRQRQAEIEEVQFGITIANYELAKAQLRQQLNQLRLTTSQFNLSRNADIRNETAEQRAAFKDRVELGAVKRDYAYIGGEVRRPHRMPLPFESRATLADLLFQEDGLNINFADYGEIYLMRRDMSAAGGGGITAFHLNAANAANLTTAAMMELRPNDVVFVAEQPITAWNRVINQIVPSLIGQAATVANATGG